MIPPLPKIEDYQISPENGFLPAEPPLETLPDPYYKPWEDLVANMQALIAEKEIRRAIRSLPELSTSRLRFEPEWRRAYSTLGFLVNAYIWGLEEPEDRVPRSISVPFLSVSAYLGLPPIITYAGLTLWNFKVLSPKQPMDTLNNLTTLTTFTSGIDEPWFYLISIVIEARGAPTIPLMIEAMSAARMGDSVTVTDCLVALAERILELRDLLARLYDNCSPREFYFRIRPFLAGSKNMAHAGLPHGVILEDGSGTGTYRQYSGGSNAQSSLVQFFDIALGIEHRPTGVKKDPTADKKEGTAPPSRHNFIEEMRSYMPGPHRHFLEHLVSVANIREYVEAHSSDRQLCSAYDECLRSLSSFRDQHLQIVSRYIVVPSKGSGKIAAVASATTITAAPEVALTSKDSITFIDPAQDNIARTHLTGTGGTKLIPFLKQSRDETLEPLTGAPLANATIPRETPKTVHALSLPSPPETPRSLSPIGGFAPRSCKVNDFEDIPLPRVTGVGMASLWEVGDDVGGICHC